MFFRKKILDGSDDAQFLEFTYQALLGRKPDADGRSHYLEQLRSRTLTRDEVVTAIARSDEFKYRHLCKYEVTDVLFDFIQMHPADAFLPFVRNEPYSADQLCELVNPRKWLEPAWRDYQRELRMIPMNLGLMHRKGFEWAQTMYGLDRLGMLGPERRCLGVGAGHEPLAYWLANKTGEVIATDLYEGSWTSRGSREGDPTVLDDPSKFAPFPYAKERLKFLRMNGCQLEFDDAGFDVVFSISSIEHFGGHANSARSMAEIGRVLKPGGMAAIATEAIVNDTSHEEFFRFEELLEYVVAASGLKLIQAPVFELPRHALSHPSIMPGERHHTPHLVLQTGKVQYTSVLFFLVKD